MEEMLEGEIPSLYPTGGFHMQYVCCKSCGEKARTNVDPSVRAMEVPLAVCPNPDCRGEMWVDFSQSGFGFKMPARNFSETKQGQKFKRSFTKEGEKLQKKQWDNHPVSVAEGSRIVNPTPGGPLDPKGPWAKRDPHRVTISGIGKGT